MKIARMVEEEKRGTQGRFFTSAETSTSEPAAESCNQNSWIGTKPKSCNRNDDYNWYKLPVEVVGSSCVAVLKLDCVSFWKGSSRQP